MKRAFFISLVLLIFGSGLYATTVDSMFYGAFGKVVIYQPVKAPTEVVLFVSGDGGWNQGVVDMAKNLVAQGALVAGIDILHYTKSIRSIKSDCYYPAGDFEELSLTIQKKYKFNQPLKPILVGYSSGATLVYGMLAQAPSNTFKGAVSLGFCPDIEMDKPLCQGSGLTTHVLKVGKSYYIEAARHLNAPFIVLQGMIDQVCSFEDTKKYMEGIPLGETIPLANVGHGFSITKNWLPQFISAYRKVKDAPGLPDAGISPDKSEQLEHQPPFSSNLPLTLIMAAAKESMPVVFFISGDGGWAGFEKAVGDQLAAHGMPVVGLDAQKYFWKEKLPKEAADEIGKAVQHYMQQWNRKSFVLVGYSFGACIVPFIAENFSSPVKDSLKAVYCFSPDETGDFEIHIVDMLSIHTHEKYNVLSEVAKIKPLNPVCVFGIEESSELRTRFSQTGARFETLAGSHHYNNNHKAVAELIYRDFIGGK